MKWPPWAMGPMVTMRSSPIFSWTASVITARDQLTGLKLPRDARDHDAGREEHGDLEIGGGFDVDLVEADAVLGNDLEARERFLDDGAGEAAKMLGSTGLGWLAAAPAAGTSDCWGRSA